MNGTRAEPPVNTIKTKNSTNKIMIGVSHSFLRVLKKNQKSDIIEDSDIRKPLFFKYIVN